MTHLYICIGELVERGGDENDWLGEVEVELAAGGGREGQLGRRLLENRNLHEVHPATRHAPSHQHVNPRFALLNTKFNRVFLAFLALFLYTGGDYNTPSLKSTFCFFSKFFPNFEKFSLIFGFFQNLRMVGVMELYVTLK